MSRRPRLPRVDLIHACDQCVEVLVDLRRFDEVSCGKRKWFRNGESPKGCGKNTSGGGEPNDGPWSREYPENSRQSVMDSVSDLDLHDAFYLQQVVMLSSA